MGDMVLEYRIREFSVNEYHRMAEVGIIAPGERVELLDGRAIGADFRPELAQQHGASTRIASADAFASVPRLFTSGSSPRAPTAAGSSAAAASA
jgi:hypothetical protein